MRHDGGREKRSETFCVYWMAIAVFVKHLFCYFKTTVKLGQTLPIFMKLSCGSWTCLINNFEAKLNFMKPSSPKCLVFKKEQEVT
jgi:hypothetical protein